MRELFTINKAEIREGMSIFKRPSARGIIIRDGKIAMVHSLKYDYYKFPGGGIEEGENPIDALIREVKEESGLIVKRGSIEEFGSVKRIEKVEKADIFCQENFYYLCETEEDVRDQDLDDYEEEEHFTLEWISPEVAIEVNRFHDHKEKESSFNRTMFEREARVLEILIKEKRLAV